MQSDVLFQSTRGTGSVMDALSALALAGMLLPGVAAAQAAASSPQPTTPIVIQFRPESDATMILNGKEYSISDGKAWLKETSDRFGRTDPVLIEVQALEAVPQAVELARIATETHDRVYLSFPSFDPEGSRTYLRFKDEPDPISGDPFSKGPPTRAKTTTTESRQRQIYKLEKIRKGELP